MAEAVFRCNICRDKKLYSARECLEHEKETARKGQKHGSWRMIKKKGE